MGVPLRPLLSAVVGSVVALAVVLASLPLSTQTRTGTEERFVGCIYCPQVVANEPTALPAHVNVDLRWVEPQNATVSVTLLYFPADASSSGFPPDPVPAACGGLGVQGSCSFLSEGGFYTVAWSLASPEPPGGYVLDYAFTYVVPVI